MPGFARHLSIFERPGYLAVALENNEITPGLSKKAKVSDAGREIQIGDGVLRFVRKNGERYEYRVAVATASANATDALSFPVIVDASALANGKVTVLLRPPLASLISDTAQERIATKIRAVARVPAQQKLLQYLDRIRNDAPKDGGPEAINEAILTDAYNRNGGAGRQPQRDVGEELPLSDQWMLILSVAIWLVVAPALLIYHSIRRRRERTP